MGRGGEGKVGGELAPWTLEAKTPRNSAIKLPSGNDIELMNNTMALYNTQTHNQILYYRSLIKYSLLKKGV
jgi:hypothetical protein